MRRSAFCFPFRAAVAAAHTHIHMRAPPVHTRVQHGHTVKQAALPPIPPPHQRPVPAPPRKLADAQLVVTSERPVCLLNGWRAPHNLQDRLRGVHQDRERGDVTDRTIFAPFAAPPNRDAHTCVTMRIVTRVRSTTRASGPHFRGPRAFWKRSFRFTFNKEDHTLGNLIKIQLLKVRRKGGGFSTRKPAFHCGAAVRPEPAFAPLVSVFSAVFCALFFCCLLQPDKKKSAQSCGGGQEGGVAAGARRWGGRLAGGRMSEGEASAAQERLAAGRYDERCQGHSCPPPFQPRTTVRVCVRCATPRTPAFGSRNERDDTQVALHSG